MIPAIRSKYSDIESVMQGVEKVRVKTVLGDELDEKEPEFEENARLSASMPSNLSRLVVSESFGDFESRAAVQFGAANQPKKKMCHTASAPQLFTEGSSMPGMS